MATFVYTRAKANFAGLTPGEDWDTNSYKATLVSSYTAQTSHVYASAFSGYEVADSNHTTGFSGTLRKFLSGLVISLNDVSAQVQLFASTIVWSAISVTASALVILRESGSDALSPLIAHVEFAAPTSAGGGNLIVSFPPSGVITMNSNA